MEIVGRKRNMSMKKIRVGFDFDGVIMYNPLRVIRPLMSYLKIKKVVKRKELVFFHPKTNWQKVLWLIAHQSSLFPGKGIGLLTELIQEGKIEPVLITGRSSFLFSDMLFKLKVFGLAGLFKQIHVSKNNEQPHLFKEKLLKELRLDYFVEDNWDIVNYLRNSQTRVPVFWIANWADRKIQAAEKHYNLEAALKQIIRKENLL